MVPGATAVEGEAWGRGGVVPGRRGGAAWWRGVAAAVEARAVRAPRRVAQRSGAGRGGVGAWRCGGTAAVSGRGVRRAAAAVNEVGGGK
jgi:hypothetical protein